MFPAIETPAQQRPPIIDRAASGAEIDALAILFRGQEKDLIPGRRIG